MCTVFSEQSGMDLALYSLDGLFNLNMSPHMRSNGLNIQRATMERKFHGALGLDRTADRVFHVIQ